MKSKTIQLLEYLGATSKEKAVTLNVLFNAQEEFFLPNKQKRLDYQHKHLNENHSEMQRSIITEKSYTLYPEATYSLSIFSGNLFQQVNRRKKPKIARYKKDFASGSYWVYYLL